MKKNLPNLFIGVSLGLLIAWLAGLFNPLPPPASTPANKSADIPSAPVQTPAPSPAPSPPATPAVVAAPTAARAKVAATSPEGMAVNAAAQQAALARVRLQSRTKAITNNLRQISSAAQQYMLEHGVTSASYFDLVGGTDSYILHVSPIMGEDYTGVFINQTDTEVSIVTPDGTTVTFDQ